MVYGFTVTVLPAGSNIQNPGLYLVIQAKSTNNAIASIKMNQHRPAVGHWGQSVRQSIATHSLEASIIVVEVTITCYCAVTRAAELSY